MNRRSFLGLAVTVGAGSILSRSFLRLAQAQTPKRTKTTAGFVKLYKTDAEWKKLLTPEQYSVTRLKGTEVPYSSPLLKIHSTGTFECVCCSLPLFSSKTKFESHTGWPSFWAPISKHNVRQEVDNSLSETRTEVLCARCDAHLGHVFGDGPEPTGLRYCMNGVAMKFVESARGA
jgi:peptide-methionine (R)-S-oxide reductase